MKHFLLSLFLLTSLNMAQCQLFNQTKDFDCLSPKENEYIQELYSVFEKKLIIRYGKLNKHELIFNYVKDFSLDKIDTLFLKSFHINDTHEEFQRIFIKEYLVPKPTKEEIINSFNNNDDEIIIYNFYEEDEQAENSTNNHFVINPNSVFASCIIQQKSNNYKINNLLEIFTLDISPFVAAPTISSSFSHKEFHDQLLQTYIMFHLFLLPNLHLQYEGKIE